MNTVPNGVVNYPSGVVNYPMRDSILPIPQGMGTPVVVNGQVVNSQVMNFRLNSRLQIHLSFRLKKAAFSPIQMQKFMRFLKPGSMIRPCLLGA